MTGLKLMQVNRILLSQYNTYPLAELLTATQASGLPAKRIPFVSVFGFLQTMNM